jgi:hypothetical protein
MATAGGRCNDMALKEHHMNGNDSNDSNEGNDIATPELRDTDEGVDTALAGGGEGSANAY